MTTVSLGQQLNAVSVYLLGYKDIKEAHARRLRKAMNGPVNVVRVFFTKRGLNSLKSWIMLFRGSPTSGDYRVRYERAVADASMFFSAVELYTAEERQSPYFTILSSGVPMDALATDVAQKFPNYEFAKLEKLYKLSNEALIQRAEGALPEGIAAAILGAGGVILKTVPDSLLSLPGIPKNVFELVTFAVIVVAVIAAVAFAFVFSSMFAGNKKVRGYYDFVTDCLVHISLRFDSKTNSSITHSGLRTVSPP
jgi:hypothetical protein